MEPLNVCDLEESARGVLPQMVYEYFAGGSGDELTARDNVRAWQRVRFRPRVLVDVTRRDLSTTVLGQPVSLPLLLAPCGFNALAHPEGELAVARAAAEAGTIQVVSTAATYALEDVAAAAPAAARWFQLYCYRDRGVTQALVERAVAAGYTALCLTVDAPLVGRRERDVRNRFALPVELGWKNLEPYGLDKMSSAAGGSALAQYIADIWEPGLDWRSVEWLQGLSRLPLVLKGVLRVEDAAEAAKRGVQGAIVSNHGGRQLDGALATADALAEIAAAGLPLELFVDGGIRRGADILRAIALGARAVMIGRPYLWGLAHGGQAGVQQVLKMLRDELDLAMALAGVPSIAAVDRSLVVRGG